MWPVSGVKVADEARDAMSVRIRAGFNNTDSLEMSMNISMTLGEWKVLRDELGTHNPSWELGRHISDMVSKAEGTMSPPPRE